MEEPKRTCISEQSADTRVLVSEISRLERGSVVTFEGHFSRWLGRPVTRAADIPTIEGVKTTLLREYGYKLSSVRGEGYKILTPDEMVADETRRNRMRRHATMRGRELDAVEFSSLSEPSKAQWAAQRTLAHLVRDVTSDKSLKRLEGAVTANGAAQPLALAKALDAFKVAAS